jgi:hypothetical protein
MKYAGVPSKSIVTDEDSSLVRRRHRRLEYFVFGDDDEENLSNVLLREVEFAYGFLPHCIIDTCEYPPSEPT